MPPLVRTCKQRIKIKQRVKIKGPKSMLPSFPILQGTKNDVLLSENLAQWLPKGSRLLAIEHVSSHSKGGLDSEELAHKRAVFLAVR
jgi:hypothetical protein